MDVDNEKSLLLGDEGEYASWRGTSNVDQPVAMCLVFQNPFHPDDSDHGRMCDEGKLEWIQGDTEETTAFMQDDDLLKEEGFFEDEDEVIPTKFQKTIAILMRFKKRKINFEPAAALKKLAPGDVEAAKKTPNYFHGHSLNESALYCSPDGDEMYFKVNLDRRVILDFAEKQGIVMVTNGYSFAGGAGIAYSHEMERRLAMSVSLYHHAFHLKKEFLDQNGEGWGFRVSMPQKMRLGVRMIREAWKFGGCGIQVDEMVRKDILIRNYFPLHDHAFIKDNKLHKWASLEHLFSRHPLKQNLVRVVHYFGEKTALYFCFVREYTLFLRSAALVGLVAGIMTLFDIKSAVADAFFGAFLIVWSQMWTRKWIVEEGKFSSMLGQDVEEDQQLVRDEFKPDGDPDPINVQDVMEMKFNHPVTLARRSDGTILQLKSSRRRRHMIRIFVTYPVILLMTMIMTGGLVGLTYWRMTNIDDVLVRYGASAATTASAVLFARLFDVTVPLLNSLENNRTDNEEENQLIIKSFFFYFFSTYFALFAIMFYPSKDHSNDKILKQLSTQLLFLSVIRPMIQNVQELALPRVLSHLRRRVDLAGGYCAALGSLCCCRSLDDMSTNKEDNEGRELWRESQLEKYETTSTDYLEIILQYGFMTMFATVFPWSAVAAFFYSALELRVDAIKLVRFMQRPMSRTATTVGAWNGIMKAMVVLSVVTNTYLAVMLSDLPETLGVPDTETRRFEYWVYSQYAIVFVLGLLYVFAYKTAESTSKRTVKHKLLRDHSIRHVFMDELRTKNRRQSIDLPLGGSTILDATVNQVSVSDFERTVNLGELDDSSDRSPSPEKRGDSPAGSLAKLRRKK